MSDKHNQDLLTELSEVLQEVGIHVVNLSDFQTEEDESLMDRDDRVKAEDVNPVTVSELEKIFKEAATTQAAPAKSSFAAYSYDKTTPVPLPASIPTEEQAVQYMEKQGYKHFEVYRKLGTYKAETKTEMVRQ